MSTQVVQKMKFDGVDVWSMASRALRAIETCVEIKFRAPHAIDAMLSP